MDDQIIEKIEQYLRGELKGETLSSFEEAIRSDDALAKEIEQARQGNLIMEAFFEEKMLQQMVAKGKRMLSEEKQTLEAKGPKKKEEAIIKPLSPSPNTSNSMVWLGIAASILLIVSVAGLQLGWFGSSSVSENPAVVVAEVYDIEGISSTGLLGSNTSEDSLTQQLEASVQAFDQGQYNTAVNGLQQLIGDTAFQQKPRANLLLGLSFKELDQFNEALNAFNAIPSSALLFYQEAQWFSAFTYWEMNQQNQARQSWQSIANDNNHPRTLAARALLDRISRN